MGYIMRTLPPHETQMAAKSFDDKMDGLLRNTERMAAPTAMERQSPSPAALGHGRGRRAQPLDDPSAPGAVAAVITTAAVAAVSWASVISCICPSG